MVDRTHVRAGAALETPLLEFLGAELVDEKDPAAGVSLVSGPASRNAVDFLHGGVISTVLDVAAYLALLPDLADTEEAFTHALFVSYLSAVEGEYRLQAKANVMRRSKRLAFVISELSHEKRLVACAQVIKSIVASR